MSAHGDLQIPGPGLNIEKVRQKPTQRLCSSAYGASQICLWLWLWVKAVGSS